MKTAVEWLVEQIENKNGKEFNSYFQEFIEQAKAMEKEQIIEACKQCSYSYEEAEQYYNETFKSE
jgi:hypothetical protein